METYGFDPEFLDRRGGFLTSRAAAHIELGGEAPKSLGYAATLLRDAAAVALIAGDAEKARALLGQAGTLLDRLGIPHGHVLRLLANEDDDAALSGARSDAARVLHRAEDGGDAEAALRPALKLPMQRLALVQALSLDNNDNGRGLGRRLRERDLFSSQPAGPSGLPMRVYLELLDRFEKPRDWMDTSPRSEEMSRLVALRLGQVEAMRADSFHWKQLLSPAALLDISIVVLGAVAIRNGRTEFEDLAEDDVAWLPIRAARMLGTPKPGPEPLQPALAG